MMILITGAIVATDETEAELRRLCLEHVARSRTEPGCLSHDVHADCENPLRLVFVERWADLDAVKAHFARPESLGFIKAARGLAVGGAKAEVYEATAVTV
jgi:quinol monooxygenase YgiN